MQVPFGGKIDFNQKKESDDWNRAMAIDFGAKRSPIWHNSPNCAKFDLSEIEVCRESPRVHIRRDGSQKKSNLLPVGNMHRIHAGLQSGCERNATPAFDVYRLPRLRSNGNGSRSALQQRKLPLDGPGL